MTFVARAVHNKRNNKHCFQRICLNAYYLMCPISVFVCTCVAVYVLAFAVYFRAKWTEEDGKWSKLNELKWWVRENQLDVWQRRRVNQANANEWTNEKNTQIKLATVAISNQATNVQTFLWSQKAVKRILLQSIQMNRFSPTIISSSIRSNFILFVLFFFLLHFHQGEHTHANRINKNTHRQHFHPCFLSSLCVRVRVVFSSTLKHLFVVSVVIIWLHLIESTRSSCAFFAVSFGQCKLINADGLNSISLTTQN